MKLCTFVLFLLLVNRIQAANLPVLPSSYNAYVEVNDFESRTTLVFSEYFDGPNNRARADFFASRDLTGSAVFLYNQNEAASLVNGNCYNSAISATSKATNPFGYIPTADGKVNITTTAQIFQFGTQYNVTYVGTDTIRGLPADKWTSNTTSGNTTTYINYYFAMVSKWSYTSTTSAAVPLRVETLVEKDDVSTLTLSYDYFGFNVQVYPTEHFSLYDCSSNFTDGHEAFAGILFGIAVGVILGLVLAKWVVSFSMKDKEVV